MIILVNSACYVKPVIGALTVTANVHYIHGFSESRTRLACCERLATNRETHLTLTAQDCRIQLTSCLLPLCDIHKISQRTLTNILKS